MSTLTRYSLDKLGKPELVIVIALVVVAPVFRGGNRHVVMAGLLLLALTLVSILASRLTANLAVTKVADIVNDLRGRGLARLVCLIVLLSAPLYIGLFQVARFGFAVDNPLFQVRMEISELTRDILSTSLRPYSASINPDGTVPSFLSGFTASAILAATLLADDRQLRKIVLAWIFCVVFQIAVVILQISGPYDNWAYFGSEYQAYRYIGSLNSRNTLSALFAGVVPYAFWRLFIYADRRDANITSKPWIPAGYILLLVSVAILTFAMQSRGGLITYLIAVIGSLVLGFAIRGRSSEKRTVGFVVWGGMFVAVAVSMLVGWDVITERLSLFDETRRSIASAAWLAVSEMWPAGSGLGSFGPYFPRFQELDAVGYFSHAHNDYVQYLFEVGAIGLVPFGAFLLLVAMKVCGPRRRSVDSARKQSDISIGYPALISFLALSIHSLVEFNMHIPCLQLLMAFNVALLLRSNDVRI